MNQLRDFCDVFDLALSNQVIFRFACYNSFDIKDSKKEIKNNIDNPNLSLRMDDRLKKQFEKLMFFPIPGLRTIDGKSKVIYFKPSLLFPLDSPFSVPMMVKNVCYVYNDISRMDQDCRDGVAIVVDMAGYSSKNYSTDAARKVMAAVQGQVVPCNISLFIVVDPPKILKRLWKVSKPILSSSFQQKTKMIKKHELATFLMKGYEQYLPSVISSQGLDTAELVEDYIDLKTYDDR